MEDTNVQAIANISNTTTSVWSDQGPDDISAYREPLSIDDCRLTDNAYYGEDGFRTCSYLVPFSRENFYNGRRQISTYKNQVKPILDAMVDPVFKDVIARNFANKNNTDSLFSDFIENVDNANTTLQEFMDEATRILVRHGQVFVVVDNFPIEMQPKTKQEAKNNRILPYIILKTKLDVADDGKAYTLDRWGNLASIIFIDVKIKRFEKEIQLYRKWDANMSVLLQKTNGIYEPFEQPVEHGLGRIPVITAYRTRRHDKQKLYVNPPAYDFVRASLSIFNLESELRDLQRSQAFAILVVQSDNRNHLGLGSHNVLFVGKDTSIPPGFISPSTEIMTSLAENIKRHQEDLYRLAEQSGVTGVRTESSGITESFKFFGHESVLRQVSMLAKSLEESIAKMFSAYTKEDLSDYDADYPTDFSPANVNSEVDMIDKYLKMNPASKAKALAMEKVTRLVLADQDEKRLQEAIDEIKKEPIKETKENTTTTIEVNNETMV